MSQAFPNRRDWPTERRPGAPLERASHYQPTYPNIPIPIARNVAPAVDFSLPRVKGSLLPALFSGELAKALPPRINGSLLTGVIHHYRERERQLVREGRQASQLQNLARGGRLDVPTDFNSELSSDNQARVEPLRRLENPLGEAAARYLALNQPQPVARQSQAPQGPTFLEQSEEYRRKAKALHESGLRKQTASTPVPAPAPRMVEPAVSDDFLRFAFQRFREAMAQARTPAQRAYLVKELDQVKRRMAEELVTGFGALKNSDGYIIIGNMTYGTQEAFTAALKDLDYFQDHDRHLPLHYPVGQVGPDGEPIPPQGVEWSRYDITKQYDKICDDIVSQVRKVWIEDEYKVGDISPQIVNQFRKNFPNNSSWDLQVGHNLPGQAAIRDPKTGNYFLNKYGDVITIDQFAAYNGNIVKAGFFSNFVYGRASFAARIPLYGAIVLAQGASLYTATKKHADPRNKNNFDLSTINTGNLRDNQYIEYGYKSQFYKETGKIPSN